MQDGMRTEILAQPAVERRECMRRREAFLEQQPHRIAFVAEGRLHADEHIAELLAEHEYRASIGLDACPVRVPIALRSRASQRSRRT